MLLLDEAKQPSSTTQKQIAVHAHWSVYIQSTGESGCDTTLFMFGELLMGKRKLHQATEGSRTLTDKSSSSAGQEGQCPATSETLRTVT